MSLNIHKKFNTVDICGLVQKIDQRAERGIIIPERTAQLKNLIGEFDKTKQYHFISVTGGFDCVNFIDYIADNEHIKNLLIASLRIGDTEIEYLNELCNQGKIDGIDSVVSKTFERTNKKYKYFDLLKKKGINNNWNIAVVNNHSKVILFKTTDNYYVLETSANLNTNVKLEQFSLTNSFELWQFYSQFYQKILKGVEICEKL